MNFKQEKILILYVLVLISQTIAIVPMKEDQPFYPYIPKGDPIIGVFPNSNAMCLRIGKNTCISTHKSSVLLYDIKSKEKQILETTPPLKHMSTSRIDFNSENPILVMPGDAVDGKPCTAFWYAAEKYAVCHSIPVHENCASATDRLIFTGTVDGKLAAWDAATQKLVQEYTLPGRIPGCVGLAVDQKSQSLAVVNADLPDPKGSFVYEVLIFDLRSSVFSTIKKFVTRHILRQSSGGALSISSRKKTALDILTFRTTEKNIIATAPLTYSDDSTSLIINGIEKDDGVETIPALEVIDVRTLSSRTRTLIGPDVDIMNGSSPTQLLPNGNFYFGAYTHSYVVGGSIKDIDHPVRLMTAPLEGENITSCFMSTDEKMLQTAGYQYDPETSLCTPVIRIYTKNNSRVF